MKIRLFITIILIYFSLYCNAFAFKTIKTIPVPSSAHGSNFKEVAVDSIGNIFAITGFDIIKFDKHGNVLKIHQEDRWEWHVQSIAIDKNDNIYVFNVFKYSVIKYSNNFKRLLEFGAPGSNNGQLGQVSDIDIDSEGYIYVADTGNDRIQKFSSSGNYLKQWGQYGNENDQFYGLSSVSTDSNSNIYTTTSSGMKNLIQKWSSHGSFIMAITRAPIPRDPDRVGDLLTLGVDVGPGDILVSFHHDRLQKFSTKGVHLGSLRPPDYIAITSIPQDIFVGSNGYIYLTTSERIFIFDWDIAPVSTPTPVKSVSIMPTIAKLLLRSEEVDHRELTKSLAGDWRFTYTIGSSTWTKDYWLDLNDVWESSSIPGQYYIGGKDQYGDFIFAGYSIFLKKYSLLDEASAFNRYFSFSYTSSDRVSGCYYQVDTSDGSLSACYPMTGTQLSIKSMVPNRKTAMAFTLEREFSVEKEKKELNTIEPISKKSLLDRNLFQSYEEMKILLD